MAKSKIYLGSTNIGSLFQGADDISIYLGSTLVYSGGTPPTPTRADFEIYDVNGDILTSGYCQDLTDNTLTFYEVTNNGTINYDLMYSAFVGDCVTTIQDATFNGIGLFGIPSFTSITIGCGVTTIGKNAISGCYGLTSINIPSGVTSIGEQAFESCSGLTSITVEATTPPALGRDVFNNTNNCPIYVPCESVNAYKSAWSQYASRITCVEPVFQGKWKATYQDSHTDSAECEGSSSIEYGEIDLTDLVSVEIGDCVESIGNHAFRDCTSLTSIDIPDSVTSIGDSAFGICSSLTSIDILSGVTSIGNDAFEHCSGLTSVIVNATTPPTLGTNVFYDTNNCPIYVPSASVKAYKTATNWRKYASRIQPIP